MEQAAHEDLRASRPCRPGRPRDRRLWRATRQAGRTSTRQSCHCHRRRHPLGRYRRRPRGQRRHRRARRPHPVRRRRRRMPGSPGRPRHRCPESVPDSRTDRQPRPPALPAERERRRGPRPRPARPAGPGHHHGPRHGDQPGGPARSDTGLRRGPPGVRHAAGGRPPVLLSGNAADAHRAGVELRQAPALTMQWLGWTPILFERGTIPTRWWRRPAGPARWGSSSTRSSTAGASAADRRGPSRRHAGVGPCLAAARERRRGDQGGHGRRRPCRRHGR
jgi:hypothetical protein